MEEEAEKLKKLQSQVDQEMSNTPVLSSANSSKTSKLSILLLYIYILIFLFNFYTTRVHYIQLYLICLKMK